MRRLKSLTVYLAIILMLAPLVMTSAYAKEAKKGSYEFKCIDPRPTGKEAQDVINVLNKMLKALARVDFKTFSENLDEQAYMFDVHRKDVVRGKENIIERMKSYIKKEEMEKSPLLSFTIREPYAIAQKDIAVVTYSAEERYGGVNPRRFESKCTNVFVKRENKWYMLQHREEGVPSSGDAKSKEK